MASQRGPNRSSRRFLERTLATVDGRLIVIAGASRSGKTAYTRREVKRSRAGRVIAWDPEAQWCALPGWRKVTTRRELLDAAQRSGPLKVAYVAGGDLRDEFGFFAGCALAAGRYRGPITVIAEELADVTSPAKAPGNWGVLLRRGLKRGITVYAISQRWAEADKTALGNMSEAVIFRQATGDDAVYMARKTRVARERIDGLKPLEFVHYDAHSFEITPGRLKF